MAKSKTGSLEPTTVSKPDYDAHPELRTEHRRQLASSIGRLIAKRWLETNQCDSVRGNDHEQDGKR